MFLNIPGLISAVFTFVLAAAPSLYSDARPPARFRQDATVILEIRDQSEIEKTCQARYGAPPPGRRMEACVIGNRAIMRNPCSFPQSESYAAMMCHELGHVNGWPATHGG